MNPKTLTPDQEAEIKSRVEEAISVLEKGGMPYDREQITSLMTKRLAEAKGWKIEAEPEADPSKPLVTVKTKPRKRAPAELAKELEGTERYWYESDEDKKFLDLFFDMRQAGMPGQLLIQGPSGSGKTMGVIRTAERRGLPLYKVDVSTITTEEKWIGHKEIDKDGTRFVLSDHLTWVEGIEVPPGVLLYDEVNRVHPKLHNSLLSILDDTKAVHVPDLGRYVTVHKDTIIVATANIGNHFGGTFTLDRAFRERFMYTMERSFPPVSEEIKILTSWTSVDEDLAKVMVEIAAISRSKVDQGDLEQPISTRTLVAAARLVAQGMSVSSAFEYSVLPMYRTEGGASSERATVKLIVSGKSKE